MHSKAMQRRGERLQERMLKKHPLPNVEVEETPAMILQKIKSEAIMARHDREIEDAP